MSKTLKGNGLDLETGIEYSDLNPNDKVIVQNRNGKCGILIVSGRCSDIIIWETLNGDEIADHIPTLKNQETKLIGRCLEKK